MIRKSTTCTTCTQKGLCPLASLSLNILQKVCPVLRDPFGLNKSEGKADFLLTTRKNNVLVNAISHTN